MNTQQVNDIKICSQEGMAKPVARPDYYYVELTLAALDDQGTLLDSLIDYTFDTLNVQRLDLRIVAEIH